MSMQQIQQAINYMEEHICEDINYVDVARNVHMSSYKGAKLHLFNPFVIKIILEGGSIMDYRMEHREQQQFIALVRAFPNESVNDDNDHSIPDFWTECDEKNLIQPMKQLRAEGKRDLYGLCSPARDSETHFNYGIGVRVDDDTDMAGV